MEIWLLLRCSQWSKSRQSIGMRKCIIYRHDHQCLSFSMENIKSIILLSKKLMENIYIQKSSFTLVKVNVFNVSNNKFETHFPFLEYFSFWGKFSTNRKLFCAQVILVSLPQWKHERSGHFLASVNTKYISILPDFRFLNIFIVKLKV